MTALSRPIKIVFFDIDETLYIQHQKRIPDTIFQRVIPELKAKNIIPAIATGRCFGAFPNAIKPLLGESGFELFVTINGQYNFYQDQLISQYPLTTQRIEQIIHKFQQLDIIYAFVSPDEIAVSADNAKVREALAPIKEDYIVDLTFYQRNNIIQMLAFYTDKQDEVVQQSGVLGSDLKAVRWHDFAVDILNKSNSKARGIQDVLGYLGLSIEDAMAFGDGHNDSEMLASVGYGVAMGNAKETLKAQADFVTLPIDEDGILYALEKLGVL